MILTFASSIKHGLFATWPPDSIDALLCDSGQLVIQFRDPWYPWDKPLMPYHLWRATYVAGRSRWTLARLKRLDYDGADKPPR